MIKNQFKKKDFLHKTSLCDHIQSNNHSLQSQYQLYAQLKTNLESIINTLQLEKEEYQFTINQNIQKIKSEFLAQITQKDKLINFLRNRIDFLTNQKKMLDKTKNKDIMKLCNCKCAIRLQQKQQQIIMLKTLINKKYMDQLKLEQELQILKVRQEKQSLLKKSFQNISSLLTSKFVEEDTTNLSLNKGSSWLNENSMINRVKQKSRRQSVIVDGQIFQFGKEGKKNLMKCSLVNVKQQRSLKKKMVQSMIITKKEQMEGQKLVLRIAK